MEYYFNSSLDIEVTYKYVEGNGDKQGYNFKVDIKRPNRFWDCIG